MSIKLNTLIPEFRTTSGHFRNRNYAEQFERTIFSSLFLSERQHIGLHHRKPRFLEASRRFYCIKLPNFWCLSGLTKSHENFKADHSMPFELIADPDEDLCNTFDVMKMKNMYGKQVRGVERSTFLIDSNGTLIAEWRKVKVPGHADEVLETLKGLS